MRHLEAPVADYLQAIANDDLDKLKKISGDGLINEDGEELITVPNEALEMMVCMGVSTVLRPIEYVHDLVRQIVINANNEILGK
jgi:hypothetical protein